MSDGERFELTFQEKTRPTYEQALESAGITLREIIAAFRAGRKRKSGKGSRKDLRDSELAEQILDIVWEAKEDGIRPPDGATKPDTPENAYDLVLRKLGYYTLAAVHACRACGRGGKGGKGGSGGRGGRGGKQGNRKALANREALDADAMKILPRLTSHELQEMLKRVALAELQSRPKRRQRGLEAPPDMSVLDPELPPEAEYMGTTADGTVVHLQCVTADPDKRKIMSGMVADIITDSHKAQNAPGTH